MFSYELLQYASLNHFKFCINKTIFKKKYEKKLNIILFQLENVSRTLFAERK